MDTKNNIETIVKEANVVISAANDLLALDSIRVKYLGKKGQLTEILKTLGSLEPSLRPQAGNIINQAKQALVEAIEARQQILQQQKLEAELAQEWIDVTLPPRGQKIGHLHPVTRVKSEIEDIFSQMGFAVIEGPEIEDEYHNFDALNIPATHPARSSHDTFYFPDRRLLRTHTSPVQIRAMQELGAPLRIITPGRVYRRDYDATHSPMFHQLEVLMVGENISFANLKWIMNKFLECFFEEKIETRFRPSYFPFTEPSAEVDIRWKVKDESRWLEVFGCGMVHPRVLEFGGIDSKRYSGFAFGLGLDRFAMLRYGINDLRLFFENDLRFLEQF